MSAIYNQNRKHLTDFSRGDQAIDAKQHRQIHIIPSSFCEHVTERVTAQPCVFLTGKEEGL